MSKRIVFGILSILSALTSMARLPDADSLQTLLLAIENSKPDTTRISLMLRVGSYYLSKRGEDKHDLDSAYTFLSKAGQLSQKLKDVAWQHKVLAATARYYVDAGNVARGEQYLRRVAAYYRRDGKTISEADTWNTLGDLLINNGRYDYEEQRLVAYPLARTQYTKANRPVEAADVLVKIAEIHLASRQFELGEKELLQTLTEYKAAGYKKYQGTYDLLYTLEYGRGNYYRAIAYASEGIRVMKASGDTALASILYHHMAHTNFIVKKYDDALEWIRKAVNADKNAFTYKCVLAQTLLELNRVEEARVALNALSHEGRPLSLSETLNKYRITALYFDKIDKRDIAIDYNLKILNLAQRKDLGDLFFNIWSVICNNDIAGAYLKENQPEKARRYLDNAAFALKNAQTLVDPRYWVVYYGHLYKYNLATGNYLAAVKNLEHRDNLEDSLFKTDRDKQVSELNIQYQTAQKEQSIKDLHNQNAVQQARVATANLQRNITIAGILIMVLVSILIFRNFRHKQLANNIITRKNELLQHLLSEKEWLLREVHHRVKNNLHTVICLLESQARYLENDALHAIETSQHRIFAMSLIHQKLYQSDDIKLIDMASYIDDLVKSLEQSFDVGDLILFNQNVDPVSLTISQAIPLGLIINEAVTNSIKYAFPDKRAGEIFISLTEGNDAITLELRDNGIGMALTEQDSEPDTLGLRLIKGLCEDIDADVDITIDNGTRITIVFRPDVLNDGESFLKSQDKTNRSV